MAKIWNKRFDSYAEAKGFADGIDFVNDSALTVLSVKLHKNGWWVVRIKDTDYKEGN